MRWRLRISRDACRGDVFLDVFMESSSEQRGEFARGNDPRGFVAAEGQQATLVAGHEITCISHQWVRSVVIAWAPRRKADSVKNGTRQVVCRRDWTTTSSCG